jgi:Cu/Ag efflux protein CusF
MKKSLPFKLLSLFFICFLIFTLNKTVFSKESQDNSLIKLRGIIADISPDTGKVAISDNKGTAISLTASLDVELKDFKAGDNVVIEYDRLSGIILSMIKQDLKNQE